jgi:hypothetical protein
MTYKNVTFIPRNSLTLEQRVSVILDQFAAKRRTIFYEDLGGMVGMLPRHKSIARALGNLAWEDVRNERPIRCSLVVRKDGHIPGDGYFDILDQIGFDIPSTEGGRVKFHRDRLDEVFGY